MQTVTYRTRISAPVETAFAWHERPAAFERLNPPWEPVEVIEKTGGIEDGAQVTLRMSKPAPIKWVVEHRDYRKNEQFCDQQISGPFRYWVHTHRFERDGDEACFLEDHIEYALPLEPASSLIAGGMTKAKLDALFRFRHQITVRDIETIEREGVTPMKIAVTGSSGLVGKKLMAYLATQGHEAVSVTRKEGVEGAIVWKPKAGKIDPDDFKGIDVVIHLAGESIAEGRWNEEKKRRIRESRVEGTRLLAEALAKVEGGPKTLICASAIGYYGDRGSEVLTEESEPGDTFLADVCKAWEEAADPAREAGLRVAHLRLGVVLSPEGGALEKMLTPFKLGGGGNIGDGKQYWSWVSIEDVFGAMGKAINDDKLRGAVNVTSPNPVTNQEFTKTLGKVLRRPTLVPMPAFAARTALGEMADALLLASARVEPRVLSEAGYEFLHPDLEPALRTLLGK